ncbi:hypothetical protein N9023_05615 [Opitutaceae bacterium]|nr:hypothetical protein [Opitutaceae bacterium]
MKNAVKFVLLMAVGLGGLIPSISAQGADILPALRRQEVVDQAKTIIDPPAQPELTVEINSPFFPNSLKPKAEEPLAPVADMSAPVVAVAPASVYELLGEIAPQINPTGAITLNGQPLLLFGQKRIRVGDQLPIIYDGENYTLLISRIESSNFTLRLGAAEVTRPIKNN